MTGNRSGLHVILIGAGALCYACGDSTNPDGNTGGNGGGSTVATVEVTPVADTIVRVGTTLQLSAVAQDASGATISGRSFIWSSSASSVAKVDANGLVTAAGNGSATISASADGISGTATITVDDRTLSVTGGPVSPRQGDVVTYTAERRDPSGTLITGDALTWSVVPSTAGFFANGGVFVGYAPGDVNIVVQIQNLGVADTMTITIQDRGLSGSFTIVGQGVETDRWTSDLWMHGNFGYTGTWALRNAPGDQLFVWDITDPTSPVRTDSVAADAFVVNDVKIDTAGTLAVITHESSTDGLNGITLLDLSDPAHPSLITRFTDGLESGVHNVWIEGDYVYAVTDGPGDVKVIDISDRANPVLVANYFAGFGFVHDVYVRDGLAFLSHWDAGLVILDVGNDISGGSPVNPVEVSRTPVANVEVHNAWYWLATGYVFIGDETSGGKMHVIDASDLTNPSVVASFQTPGTPPHNFWLDEAKQILYAAWYDIGLLAIDVSGQLLGQLERQGREIARISYGSGFGCPSSTGSATCTWAPQLHNGLVYVSDMNTGLWVFDPSF